MFTCNFTYEGANWSFSFSVEQVDVALISSLLQVLILAGQYLLKTVM